MGTVLLVTQFVTKRTVPMAVEEPFPVTIFTFYHSTLSISSCTEALSAFTLLADSSAEPLTV